MRKLLIEVDCGSEFCEQCKMLRLSPSPTGTLRTCELYGELQSVRFAADPTIKAFRTKACIDAEDVWSLICEKLPKRAGPWCEEPTTNSMVRRRPNWRAALSLAAVVSEENNAYRWKVYLHNETACGLAMTKNDAQNAADQTLLASGHTLVDEREEHD